MLKKLFSICALSLGVLLSPGFAATLTLDPGGSTFTGVEVADTSVLNFSDTSPDVTGTLEQRVYQQTAGTFNFYYLLTNSSLSQVPIFRITSTNFAGDSVAVAFLSIPVGGVPPFEADRSVDGSTVGFDLFLAPDSGSAWLEISTSATAFALTGSTTVIDSDNATVGSLTTYSPVTVPEPLSTTLLMAGFAALALLGLRRGWTRELVAV